MSQADYCQICPDIGRSKLQSAFVAIEDCRGRLVYPTKAHFIAITNDATMSQAPEYSDSTEKLGTRDVVERFKNAMPAANATLAMNIDVSPGLGAKPQGYDVFLSLFGTSTLEEPREFTMDQASAGDTELDLQSVGEFTPMPPCGVIQVGSELIFYGGISDSGMTLLECKRGYRGTTASAISAGESGEYKSLAFLQTDCNPSFSYWLRTDHFLQAITGATINSASLSLSNTGAINIDFTAIQGMRMLLAGTSKVSANVPIGSKVIPVDTAASYTEGAWVWNKTMGDNGGGSAVGYKVQAVNEEAGTITLSTPIQIAWPAESVVAGFYPQDAERIGEPIKGDTADVFINGIRSKIRNTSLSYSNNISYLNDELGTLYPENYVESARNIELQLDTYFRKEDAVRFKEGYEGRTIHVRISFGDGKVILDLPKVQQSIPTPTMQDPTVSLSITGTVRPQGKGNNAMFLIFN